MPEKKRSRKGFFGRAVLPVAGTYLNPQSRNGLMALGGAAAVALGLGLAVGIWLTGGGLASSGPLSSSHSALESDCANCHDAFQSVSDRKCLDCHQRTSPPRDHTLAAHLASGSDNVASFREGRQATPCFACHREHRGRRSPLASPADENCASCHPFEPFRSAHPEFAFLAAGNEGVDAAFSHPLHLEAVREEARIDETQELCFLCHDLRPDRRSFAPIEFDVHCENCHVGSEGLSDAESGTQASGRDGFDHGAHMIQRSCLDCHAAIPSQGEPTDPSESQNASGNLPGIQVCRQCHNAGTASDRCTLCHRFHPSPTAQSPTSAG